MSAAYTTWSSWEKRSFGLFAFLTALLFLWSASWPFFADGVVQSSMAGQFFYDTSFSSFFIPEDQNPGHPPFWGMYLALWWFALGKSLWVSHLACLPFLWIALFQFVSISRYWIKSDWVPFAMLLFFFEPTWIAQSTQVLPDLALNALFLLGLRGILYQENRWLILAGILLPLLNTRGIMLIAVLGILDVGKYWLDGGKGIPWKSTLKYIAPVLVAITWMVLHYGHSGWLGFNREEMPWRESFETVDFSGWLRNLAIIVWRFLDFGRLGLWLLLFGILVFTRFSSFRDASFRSLLWVTIIPLLVFLPVTTGYIGTLQHRYYLPSFLLSIILLIYVLQEMKLWEVNVKRIALFIVLASFLSGHFWVYPDKISQGWDASLAHIPYFSLREEMLNDLHESGIDINRVSTGTPNKFKLIYTDLREEEWQFLDHTEVDIDDYPYVLYSNISNDFDQVYDRIHQDWIFVKAWKQGGISLRLFKNPSE